MADMVLRNLDDDLKQRLRERAAKHGRSMAAELRAIVSEALTRPDTDPVAEFKRLATISRAMSAGRSHTPSEVLLRESRDKDAK
ncbi:MAG TPA: Arc family DNA-binding protein [Denitromonas sp.]|uniref:FitA-like ribbon-helix-helix domain-containing protein n=1 Tax=Denitromonas sp. TaxID=2734609 RepID=UPI001E11E68B|nr:Arc family DNA-binding protein [Denitromonas sp.]MCB1951092.1 Arc family DNA-binding protein [Rhodocyclaceae bacterium]MCP5222294.1 Arc family DNA-binding protein [Zoogloeaceae bacterium]HPR05559.1 Arc family DNA-binding protein [Denitromonas sp.]HQU88480.1 Arc family DNA-binding protein [Denitromonas sp.]HQV14580.1 Arc family DNA-binding protein [Denitromonas sp.]